MARLLVCCFFVFSSCMENPRSGNEISFKDSIVQEHLAHSIYDTSHFDRKVLRAYHENDTAFFVWLNETINQSKKEREHEPDPGSCIQLQSLSSLDVDEAYRFTHRASYLCFYYPIVTISRKNDSIHLHYLEYSNGQGNSFEFENGEVIHPYCVIRYDFKKLISIQDWENFERKLLDADYWGLKGEFHRMGPIHPTYWVIEGYKKESYNEIRPQNLTVKRSAPTSPAFKEIGFYLMKLAEKKACVIR